MKKLIMWQVGVTLGVLAAFFIALQISGGVNTGIAATSITATAFALGAFFGGNAAFVGVFAGGTIVVCSASVVFRSIADAFVSAFVFAGLFVGVSFILILFVNGFHRDSGVSKKAIWISCVVQFIATLTPMLWVILQH